MRHMDRLIWILLAMVIVVIGIAVAMSVFYGGHYASVNYTYPYGMMAGYSGAWIFFPVAMMIGFVFVILIIYFLVSTAMGAGHSHFDWNEDNPEKIAKERYARGEINEEEYTRIINTLRK